jgi:hypothetical protein
VANADLVEVIVRPRCRLRGDGGAVHLPGARLKVTDDEYAALARRRVVRLASAENVAAIDAIARGLPVPGYTLADDLGRRSRPGRSHRRRPPCGVSAHGQAAVTPKIP